MRGLSTTIVVILTLMIGISLVSVGYVFFIGAMEETTEVGEAVVEKTTQLLTTKYKIESLEQGTPGHIYIRNMGSNDVTDISIYINDVLDTTAEIPPLIAPSEVGTINVTAGLSPGDQVKVSGAQGSFVIGSVPGGAPPPPPCTPDGCNANCPAGCTVADDPDCGCQDGDGCCGIGCIPANDNDCVVCLLDGSACTTGNQCCNGICEAGICVTLCGPCGAACSEGGYPFSDGTHTCDGSVNDACNLLNGVWDTCSQTGDSSDADCNGNCQSGLSYCTTGGANPPFYWGRCVDLQNDDCSCGSCGNDCTAIGQICQAGSCVPTGTSPVAFWTFDGDTTDSSGNGNDGTLFGPTFVNGVSGSALNFDGINDYVRVEDDITLDLTDEFTFAAWIHPRTFGEGSSPNGYGRIINKAATGGYSLYIRNNSAQDQLASLINGSVYASSFDAIQLGVWQYVTVTFDSNLGSNQVEFFVDSAPAGTANRNQPTQTNNNRVFIGNRAATDRTFDGIIDDVKIWNRPLTPVEISAEYSSYGAPPPAGPDTGWGQTTDLSYSSFSPGNLRCMGGQAPNLPNMRIKSLHFKSNNTATASMGVYFGGGEWNPNGAPLFSSIVTQSVNVGWNTFTLPTEVSWPENTVTWVCLNTTGNIHYVSSAPGSTDFYTSHGRHHHWNSEIFPSTLGQANFTSYWYEVYLTYYQSST